MPQCSGFAILPDGRDNPDAPFARCRFRGSPVSRGSGKAAYPRRKGRRNFRIPSGKRRLPPSFGRSSGAGMAFGNCPKEPIPRLPPANPCRGKGRRGQNGWISCQRRNARQGEPNFEARSAAFCPFRQLPGDRLSRRKRPQQMAGIRLPPADDRTIASPHGWRQPWQPSRVRRRVGTASEGKWHDEVCPIFFTLVHLALGSRPTAATTRAPRCPRWRTTCHSAPHPARRR